MPGAEAVNAILALSILLVAGFAGAVLARLVRLPSVTGYVVGGMLIGPAGFDLFPPHLLESQLSVFTGIALMLVAFGIGERFELQQLRQSARALARVSIGESGGAFCLVLICVTLAAGLTRAGGAAAGLRVWLATGLICGAIAVATAPASTTAVIRELRASGPLSRLTVSAVVVNNALSITLFGLTAGAAKVLLGTADASVARMAEPVFTTVAALTVGLAIGWLTDLVVHRLTRPPDVLVVALASVFFTGGFASYLGLSPLLAGVAAGFAVVNRDRRDVRAFRALNDFEPPLYAIFFALAGAELRWSEMLAGGAVGICFVLARGLGKYAGARFGARSADMPRDQAKMVGLGLLPQAGLAIGLAVLVSQDQALAPIRALIINVTVASVVLNELVGPPLLRLVLIKAGETAAKAEEGDRQAAATEVDVVPWRWAKLEPAANPHGSVVAALGSAATAAGIVRMATLLAHHFRSVPLAAYIGTQPDAAGGFWSQADEAEAAQRFRIAAAEAREMGYPLRTELRYASRVADGILDVAKSHGAHSIVLGHPLARKAKLFGRVVDAVAQGAPCPVVVVKLAGSLHSERVLVPVTALDDLEVLTPVVHAIAGVGQHEISVLRLLPVEQGDGEVAEQQIEPSVETFRDSFSSRCRYRAVAPHSRVRDILDAALEHDLVIMATGAQRGLGRFFFGSLAEDVAERTRRPMLVVCGGAEQPATAAREETPAAKTEARQ